MSASRTRKRETCRYVWSIFACNAVCNKFSMLASVSCPLSNVWWKVVCLCVCWFFLLRLLVPLFFLFCVFALCVRVLRGCVRCGGNTPKGAWSRTPKQPCRTKSRCFCFSCPILDVVYVYQSYLFLRCRTAQDLPQTTARTLSKIILTPFTAKPLLGPFPTLVAVDRS